MPRDINIMVGQIVKGGNVQMPSYTCEATVTYTRDDGTLGTWTGTLRFPQDLADVSLAWLRVHLLEFMLKAKRRALGLEPDERG